MDGYKAVSGATTEASTSREQHTHSPLTLLGLPAHIRRRIYLHVGLARWDGLPYVFDLHGREARFQPSPSPGSFNGLLLSCRLLHDEAAALLYSSNHFVLDYSQPASFAPLHALTVPSLASLTSLRIVLNQSSCHEPDTVGLGNCCRHGHKDEPWPRTGIFICTKDHADKHSPPLLSLSGRGSSPDEEDCGVAAAQAMLSEWHSTAVYMSSLLSPGNLDLSLICDIDPRHPQAVEVAAQAVAPLSLLPLLKNCHVRLCESPDRRLQQVASDAVMRARGVSAPYSKPPPTATPFLSLPRELRLLILEYTDLITPWREVMRSRCHRGYTVLHIPCHRIEYLDCPLEVHPGCQFSRCWGNPDIEPRIGCFCRLRHAASSSRCVCWSPPSSLFLVCRTLRQDAELVFFSGNRFVVNDVDSHSPSRITAPSAQAVAATRCYPFERFAASQFLREVVPTHCLAHLRFLEIVFPPYPHDHWPQPEDPAMKEWCSTVTWLRDKINARGLTVSFVAADVDNWEPPPEREQMTRQQGVVILDSYIRIVRPLRCWAAGEDGLAGFRVRLADPWGWTERRIRQLRKRGLAEKHEATERELKAYVEGSVMGERYRADDTKKGPPQCLWPRAFNGRI
ncbi:hypothetical protein F5144DRAFT_491852 [Chaetomium tenue]|uniref:Uncharacterized protein n=1 Tax=Chaetomium tenue TaxID=1854479 RepID=A0ACB7P360_9PEZI|nr:hypothetical protein F5144DRAFT_491852 [Chaetomium globosum]